jgi:hypothetical protein
MRFYFEGKNPVAQVIIHAIISKTGAHVCSSAMILTDFLKRGTKLHKAGVILPLSVIH